MPAAKGQLRFDWVSAWLSEWQESLYGMDLLMLFASPVYYGFGAPRGDGSGVLLIPAFLHSDAYLIILFAWLQRLGYRPYYSGIQLNAECPNLLIHDYLHTMVDRAHRETGRKVHVIGHSLGGILARSLATIRRDDIASVTTLGAPFGGGVVPWTVLQDSDRVREFILRKHGTKVLPACYTVRCECEFMRSMRRAFPNSVRQTAVYTRSDGVVDWHDCITGDPTIDVEVPGTHAGLAFNASVYTTLAERLPKQ
ncbi:MAG TPA: hypothetical protein VD837_05450 [Terriglobales bacterium]|nr:hypothetical protein [Terriglobales bacterium]